MAPYRSESRTRPRGMGRPKGKPKGKSRSKDKNKNEKKLKPRKRRVRTSKVITKDVQKRFVADLEKRSGKPISEWFEILKKVDPQKKLMEEELGVHLAKNFRLGKWDGKLIAFYYQHPERLEVAE
jgi:hypothetical protein